MARKASKVTAYEFLFHLARKGRSNVHARLVVRPGEKPTYQPERRPVNEADIRAHLLGTTPIGIYLVVGMDTQVAAIDLDDHEGEPSFDGVRKHAAILAANLKKHGFPPICFRSGGGKGIHIWVVWQEPQNARNVRRVFRRIIAESGLKTGTGGVKKGEVELFPKQDEVTGSGLGNLIALPLSRKSVPLTGEELVAVDIDEFGFPKFETLFSAPCTAIEDGSGSGEEPANNEEKDHRTSRLPGDEAEAEAALRYVSAVDRDVWVRIGNIMKYEFGEAGFPIWLAWSKTGGEKYEGESDCRKVWDGLRPTGKVGLGTLFYLAQRNGWNGPGTQIIREMNSRFAVLTRGNQTAVILKNGDRRPDDVFPWLSKQTFFDRLIGETTAGTDGGARVSLAKFWFSHALRESYHYLDFDPSKPPGGNGKTWNMWTGFSVSPKEGNWSLFKAHIRDNICQSNGTLAEWLMNWMALGIQKPALVIGTVPVLRGLPGTGKGILANAYGKLWGAHYVTVTHQEHVTGRFGAHFLAKRFCFIDEGLFGGDRKMAGVIKTRVTEPKIIVEQKNVDPIQLDNRMIFMIASNEQSIVPADLGDRRWMMFEVGAERREDHAYFSAMVNQLENGGYEAMLHELLHRDITSGPNPRRIIKNEGLADQMMRSLPPDIRYIQSILDEGRLPQSDIAGPVSTTIQALWDEMQRTQPDHKWISAIALGKLIRQIFPSVTTRQNGRYRVANDRSGNNYERSTQYNFPPLDQCRREFAAYVGAPVRWSNDATQWEGNEAM